MYHQTSNHLTEFSITGLLSSLDANVYALCLANARRKLCTQCQRWYKNEESLRKHKKKACLYGSVAESASSRDQGMAAAQHDNHEELDRSFLHSNLSFSCKGCDSLLKNEASLRTHQYKCKARAGVPSASASSGGPGVAAALYD